MLAEVTYWRHSINDSIGYTIQWRCSFSILWAHYRNIILLTFGSLNHYGFHYPVQIFSMSPLVLFCFSSAWSNHSLFLSGTGSTWPRSTWRSTTCGTGSVWSQPTRNATCMSSGTSTLLRTRARRKIRVHSTYIVVLSLLNFDTWIWVPLVIHPSYVVLW